MTEVTGRIESIDEKQAKNGGSYLVVNLEGYDQGFFDWQNHVGAAEVDVGDSVRIEHSDGKFPRIRRLEKIDEDEVKPPPATARRVNGKEQRIVRLSCLKTAVELLSQSELEYETRELQVVELAERMEAWVLR